MSKFETMTSEERQGLITKVAQCLKDNGLGDVPISTSVENVGVLMAGTFEKKTTLEVKKDLKDSQEDLATKFKESVKPHIEGVEGVTVAVQALLGAGSQYKTIKDIQTMESEDTTTLEHVPGQVWMVDFWATWCPPCQAPMAHNVAMLEKRGADWGTDVRIIGLSIDQDKAKLVSHVADKGWGKVEHFFKGASDASKTYSVNGVPHVMLIDKTGKIVFKGHPANRPNLEEDFDTLRNGGTISGEGCASADAPAESGETPIPEGYAEMDDKELEDDIKQASDAIEALTKDTEVVEIAKQCPRAFCVLVCDKQFNPNTGKTLVKYENYRVLVGSQENIDKLKAKIEEKVTGKFKVVLREQVM